MAFESSDESASTAAVRHGGPARPAPCSACAASLRRGAGRRRAGRRRRARTRTGATSASPSRPSTTSSASGASPAVTGKPVGATSASRRRRCRSPSRWPADGAAADELRGARSANGRARRGRAVARATALIEACGGRERHRAAPRRAARRRPRRPRRPPTSTRRPRAELAALARFVWSGSVTARRPATAACSTPVGVGPRRAGRGSIGRLDRARCAARRPAPRRAGGRASSRPTSPWTPRTCCCGEFLGIRDAEHAPSAPRRWIRSQQRDDGTWATFYGGPRRPLDHGRGLRRAAAGRRPGRRRAHAARRPAFVRDAGRHRARPGLHPHLAGAVRPCGRGTTSRRCRPRSCCCRRGSRSTSTTSPAGPARRSSPLTVVAAHRPVRPLPFDARRAAHRRAAARRGARRARIEAASSCSTACCTATSATRPKRLRGAARSTGRVTWIVAPPGGRRLVGRHPAAVGLLADGPAPARATRSTIR